MKGKRKRTEGLRVVKFNVKAAQHQQRPLARASGLSEVSLLLLTS